MVNNSYKRYVVWGITVFSVVALSIILFFVIYRASGVGGALRSFLNILRPFIYGFALAYILNPIYRRCDNLLMRLLAPRFKKQSRAVVLSRVLSTTITLLITCTALFGLLYLVLPQLVFSVVGVIEKAPGYLTEVEQWLRQLLEDSPDVGPLLLNTYKSVADSTELWLRTEMMPLVSSMAMHAYNGLLSTVSLLFDLIIGIIVMVYLLNGKQTFAAQGKKLLYSLLPPRVANLTIENLRYMHRVFGGFINGKLLDSLIIGVICFIFLFITKMPYIMLISVIVGVTNIIPFFGPFIGAIPSALLLLFENPLLCVYFLIFIIILQQIDGNIIGPKILGGTTGLPSFWVLFSILLFGGLFGFIGMIIGVPVFAVTYSLVNALCRRSLHKRSLPTDTESYRDLHHIDEQNLQPVKNGK